MPSPITYNGPYDFKLVQQPPVVTNFRDAQEVIRQLYITIQQMVLAINSQSGLFGVPFSEGVGFGKPINLYLASGVVTARNANSGTGGTSGTVQPCHGYCSSPGGVLTGASAWIQTGHGNLVDPAVTFTIGANYWLAPSNGGLATSRDVSAGHVEQFIGVATTTHSLTFVTHTWVQH